MISHRPLVSIFMPVRNGMPWVQRALESLYAQRYSPIEIIIQDCLSEDGTKDYLLSQGDKIQLVSEKDSSPDEGFWRAIKRCRGDIIGSCLADEALLPDAIEKIVQYFTDNPLRDVVIGTALEVDIDHQPLWEKPAKAFDMVRFLHCYYMPHFAASFYRRQTLHHIGLFDDRWEEFCFETEFWLRLACFGSIGTIKDIVTKYAIHPHQLSTSLHPMTGHQIDSKLNLLKKIFSDEGIFRRNSILLNYAEYFHICLGIMTLTEFNNPNFLNFDNHINRLTALKEKSIITLSHHQHHQFALQFPSDDLTMQLGFYFFREMGRFFRERGQIEQAYQCYYEALELGDLSAGASVCQIALMSPSHREEEQFGLQQKWAALLPKISPSSIKTEKNDHRLTLGYLCKKNIRENPNFIEHYLDKYHDSERFKLILYVPTNDDLTFISQAEHCYGVEGLSLESFIDRLHSDQLDIFITLAGLEETPLTAALAYRIAPIQINFSQYLGSLGLSTIDWIISDHFTRSGLSHSGYYEKIWPIEGLAFSIKESLDHPHQDSQWSQENQDIIFGCLNDSDTLNEIVLWHWALLLQKIPHSKLFIRHHGLHYRSNRAYFEYQFSRHGLTLDRLILRPGASYEQKRIDYQTIDITLDTWPFSQQSSVALSLLHGVPAITLSDKRLESQGGASLLHSMTCENWIAYSWSDYLDIAESLAKNPQKIRKDRSALRQKAIDRGLTNTQAFVLRLEQCYEQIWAQGSSLTS
jgi:predicted O-linked N-acetylglucosamine transferase (SPINDLY family)